MLWLLMSSAMAAPWTLEGSAAAVGIGFAPSSSGGGATIAAVADAAGSQRVSLFVGPRLDLDHTSAFGTWFAASSTIGGRFRPLDSLFLDVGASGGLQQVVPRRTWVVQGGDLVDGTRVPAPGARFAGSLGVGVEIPAGRWNVGPFVRYEQAVLVGFAPKSGVPLMVAARLGVGVAVQLPERSPR